MFNTVQEWFDAESSYGKVEFMLSTTHTQYEVRMSSDTANIFYLLMEHIKELNERIAALEKK